MVNRSRATLSGIGSDVVAPAELPSPVISSVFRLVAGGRIVTRQKGEHAGQWNGVSYVSCLIGKWRIGGEARRRAVQLTVWVSGAERIETRHCDAKGVPTISQVSWERRLEGGASRIPAFLIHPPPLAPGSAEGCSRESNSCNSPRPEGP